MTDDGIVVAVKAAIAESEAELTRLRAAVDALDPGPIVKTARRRAKRAGTRSDVKATADVELLARPGIRRAAGCPGGAACTGVDGDGRRCGPCGEQDRRECRALPTSDGSLPWSGPWFAAAVELGGGVYE